MTKKPEHRQALKAMRERLSAQGYPTPELKEHHKYFTKLVKDVKKAIENGHNTVPKIVEALNHEYPSHDVFHAINALRKYGNPKLKIIDKKSDEYPIYGF